MINSDDVRGCYLDTYKGSVSSTIEPESASTIDDLVSLLVRRIKDDAEKEYLLKMKDLESKLSAANEELELCRQSKLKTILDSVTGYVVKAICSLPPKCSKCDETRRIYFKSPAGRDMVEDCTCKTLRLVYKVFPAELYRITVDKDSGKIDRYYQNEDLSDLDSYVTCGEEIYTELAEALVAKKLTDETCCERVHFDQINRTKAVFLDKNLAEEFAGYLNNKE